MKMTFGIKHLRAQLEDMEQQQMKVVVQETIKDTSIILMAQVVLVESEEIVEKDLQQNNTDLIDNYEDIKSSI